MEKEFEFTSKPSTSREQSERLIALGLKKESADMHWRMHRTFEGEEIWNCYAYKTVRLGVNNMLPAWSLSRLWEILPKVVFLRPALHLTMCGDSVFYCTEDNNEDFDNGKVHVSNVYNSGCVSSVFAEKSNSIEETFNVYSDGKTVFVSHNNREVNCGYDSIMVHINVVSDTIWVKEIEMGESYANCMCMANTSY